MFHLLPWIHFNRGDRLFSWIDKICDKVSLIITYNYRSPMLNRYQKLVMVMSNWVMQSLVISTVNGSSQTRRQTFYTGGESSIALWVLINVSLVISSIKSTQFLFQLFFVAVVWAEIESALGYVIVVHEATVPTNSMVSAILPCCNADIKSALWREKVRE